MKLLKLLLLISLLSLPVFAATSQLIITKTSKKSALKSIKSKLDSLKIKMFVQKSSSGYVVYSGKYNSTSSANLALKRAKRYFPSARVVKQQSKDENTKNIKSQEKETTSTQSTADRDKNSMFIAAGFGLSSINGSTDDQTASQYVNSGMSFALEAGYYFNDNIFSSLSYLDTSTTDIAMSNAYGSLNYKLYATEDLGLYAGLLGGVSSLKLTQYEASEPSISMLLGVQAGISYDIGDNFSIYSAYQAIYINQLIELTDTSSSISFNLIHNMQVGFQLRF
ncbi:outer membrane beta-barrel protein [Sulfurimonas aquatica]|uniref:Outer membrane beta-barrel protein n=1 Tax=Sulfurimonas aquatica TaxID=2672570 RepID=A0A975AXW0_9BACT|nr:outer membrane beta-barrel protein [Sulfurimonas aquatica]QSZ40607.1 outer membrane beta-barrel protein [Sulfurimonas aquatica]